MISRVFLIKVEKVGRKWIHGIIQSDTFCCKGQFLISDYTKHFKAGEEHRVHGYLENKGNVYGAKYELTVHQLHESAYASYILATEGAEAFKNREITAITALRETFNSIRSVNNWCVNDFKKLGVYDKYCEEIEDYMVNARAHMEVVRLENSKRMAEVAKVNAERDTEQRRRVDEGIRQEREAEAERVRQRRLLEAERERDDKIEKEKTYFWSTHKYEVGKLTYRDGCVWWVISPRPIPRQKAFVAPVVPSSLSPAIKPLTGGGTALKEVSVEGGGIARVVR